MTDVSNKEAANSDGAGVRQLSCANCGSGLTINPAENVMQCLYCGQGHKFLEPPPETASHFHGTGDAVGVRWGDRWWSAHVVEVLPNRQWYIHYEGWAPQFDEVVGTDRIRAIDYRPGPSIVPPPDIGPMTVKRSNYLSAIGVIALILGAGFVFYWAIGEGPATNVGQVDLGGIFNVTPGKVLDATTRINIGQKYYVKWNEAWYRATALKVTTDGLVLVHYDGWDDSQNEYVPRSRMRLIN